MTRDFHLPGRSATYAGEAMAATSHPLATLAAIEVLRAGGSAADAAVTAVALLGVIEPHMTGIGGDCFCLVAKPGAPLWGYNGSGRAPARASAHDLLAQGVTTIGPDSIHSVTVPGAVEAWSQILAAHGRSGLAEALAPAIRYASEGFPVAPRIAHDWAIAADRLRRDPGASRHLLRDGRAPMVGDRWRFPALAKTLATIAKGGAKAFYEGEAAEDIVATVAARGGVLTRDDFAKHRGEIVTPISAGYRGLEIVELPPNGQGIAALVLLNILEQFDVRTLGPLSAERYHLMLEAGRLAYQVRDAHVADPAFMREPAADLLNKGFAQTLAAGIKDNTRVTIPEPQPVAGNTVLVTVVDRDRMAVSIINSLYSSFGVGMATEKTGIMLQNRGACFVVDPEHPNGIAPSKRPMHTIIPALAMRDGRCDMAFGVMGGGYQAMGHAHFVSNLMDYGMDVQAAIDAPRAFLEAGQTMVERGLPADTVAGLKARGHDTAVRPLPLGGAQAVRIDWDRGVLIGGSDHRKDGCALGY